MKLEKLCGIILGMAVGCGGITWWSFRYFEASKYSKFQRVSESILLSPVEKGTNDSMAALLPVIPDQNLRSIPEQWFFFYGKIRDFYNERPSECIALLSERYALCLLDGDAISGRRLSIPELLSALESSGSQVWSEELLRQFLSAHPFDKDLIETLTKIPFYLQGFAINLVSEKAFFTHGSNALSVINRLSDNTLKRRILSSLETRIVKTQPHEILTFAMTLPDNDMRTLGGKANSIRKALNALPIERSLAFLNELPSSPFRDEARVAILAKEISAKPGNVAEIIAAHPESTSLLGAAAFSSKPNDSHYIINAMPGERERAATIKYFAMQFPLSREKEALKWAESIQDPLSRSYAIEELAKRKLWKK